MKRILSALAALALVAGLGAGLAQEYDLGGRTLTVGSDTTYPPFETINDAGEAVGFDVDVLNAICDLVNCVAEFQTTAWDGIFPALAAGEFDMVASGVTITADRDEIVDFTVPYYTVDQAIAVTVDDAATTLEDFTDGDLVLGAQTGTTNATTAENLLGRDRVRLYDTFNQAVQGLINGDVDGVILDDVAAEAFAEQYAGELVVEIREVESGDELGLVVQEGDPLGILDALNWAIGELRDNGTLAELEAEWF